MKIVSPLLLALQFAGVSHSSAATPPATGADSAAPQCQMHRLASINLKRTPGGAILVPVLINQTSSFMAVETASHMSVISKRAVDRLQLPVKSIGKAMEASLAGRKVDSYAVAREFTIGGLSFPDQGFLVTPPSLPPSIYDSDEVIGTLGNGVLWKMDLELDLAHLTLNLYEPGRCTSHPVYWATEYEVVPLQRDPLGEYHFPMELDGRKLDSSFSTSNSVTTLSTDVTKRVYGFDKDSPGVEAVTDASGSTIYHYRAMKMTTSGLAVVDEQVRLVDPPPSFCSLTKTAESIGYTGCFYHTALKIGNSVLEHLHVYIDTKNNRMYYTRSDP